MSEIRKDNNLGLLLKDLLKENSLSMRNLSELTEIDTATISRIINGKRSANLQHLQRFADSLEVPIGRLLEAAGYPIANEQKNLDEDIETTVDTIQSIVKASNLINDNFSAEQIEQQLSNYKQYSQTKEGSNTILVDFEKKIQEVGSIGSMINDLKNLFEKFQLKKGTPGELALMGSALLYFIIPVDIIPDYLFAVGYLDDVIAVQFVQNMLNSN